MGLGIGCVGSYVSTKESKDCVKMTNKTINDGNSLDLIHFYGENTQTRSPHFFLLSCVWCSMVVHRSYALEFICMHVIYLFRMLHWPIQEKISVKNISTPFFYGQRQQTHKQTEEEAEKNPTERKHLLNRKQLILNRTAGKREKKERSRHSLCSCGIMKPYPLNY